MDWSESILTIRGAKFGKSRLVPVHASTCKVLADYVNRRDRRFGARTDGHFLVNKNGNPLDQGEVHRTFYRLSRQIGLRAANASRGPRLHDFRHRFAVETLLHWYRNGEDPRRRLPVLSTFLGHAHVTDTYWYPTGIASYRDTFRLLLRFAQKRLRKAPSQLRLADLHPSLIDAFLNDLENQRRNGPRSRNLRLTAIRSFFRYAALESPAQGELIQRVLAIPNQRQPRTMVGFLTRPEIEALLAAPDRSRWLGRRDHAFP